ncbi:tyrosine--tRNA ligase [Pedosphaera parvula]|uniref:Tyrosine--tRNA ligase n=1 Tax=Pedosphaera parvula (strain Ellin514) TaxID=320771 RepID=B9XHF6_PEDPL|nr:tyrosine--tRNA ligase [Pedosphaera parvula]EEF60791.1 tyrosyl-tRNA synthetase [Pedosphaera parvula Ellin514]
MNIYEELEWRGLLADCTDKVELLKRLAAGPITLYAGFDPTGDSLHVGNLVPLLALRRFQLFGHIPIALAGGATGSIGDPSGKTVERQLLTKEVLDTNIASIKVQLRRLLDFDAAANPARLLDNNTWTAPVSYLDFLREVGKHFSVNMMVAKESVRARMEDRETGISYTEFSYMLLQAFDFYHLRKEFNCELQIGGSDQWGNITAGSDLCRKKLSAHVFGLTLPLITNADGSKFGKSVAGAIWVDAKKTSVYRFYQFWINTDDRDVIRYLKFFTFLTQDEITALEQQHTANPGARVAHKALAKAMTDLIHGEQATTEAIRASEILFGGELSGISESTFNDIVGEVPTKDLEKSKLEGAGIPLVELLVHSGLSPSKGQARKDIEGGGVNLNNVREANFQRPVTTSDLLFGKHLLLRKGKKNYTVLTAH